MISLDKICGGYNKKQVLYDVSFSVKNNQITVIVGPNGSGKSTLIKIISGLLMPFSGKIYLNNQDVFNVNKLELAKKIAYLPQIRNISDIRVDNLVLHGRFPHISYPRIYRKEDKEIVQQCLEKMNISHLADKSLKQISGGERQKVYMAMVLAQDTEYVILDEPTTYLDIYHQFELMKMVCNLKEMGKTVIMVLHDLNMAFQYADNILVIDNGRLVANNSPRKIFEQNILSEIFKVDIKYAGDHYYFSELKN